MFRAYKMKIKINIGQIIKTSKLITTIQIFNSNNNFSLMKNSHRISNCYNEIEGTVQILQRIKNQTN